MTIGKIKTHDQWWTPQDVYEYCIKLTGVLPQLDVAADKNNTKCKNYFTKEQNALELSWCLKNVSTNTTKKYTTIDRVPVWCNPPGKLVQQFIDKAYDQWVVFNIDIVMLVPVNTITNRRFDKIWIEFVVGKTIDIYPLFGMRPRFLDKGKEPKFGSRNGYIIVHFKKR